MSLISSFISNQLIKALENEFLNHAPDMQDFFIKEVEALGASVMGWVQEKVEGKTEVNKESE